MPALIICIALILLLAFILLLKATLIISYDGEVGLWVRVLFIKIRLVPERKKRYRHSMSARKAARLKKRRIKKLKKKLVKQHEKEEEKAKKTSSKEEGEKKSSQDILDIIHLVSKLVTKVVGTFFKHLRIKLAHINIKVATDNAAATAITYGAVTQAINVLFPLLDNLKTVKTPQNKNINIYADFCSEEPEIDIRIEFALRVWHVMHVGIAALIQVIKHYFNSAKRKDEQGGGNDEIAEALAKIKNPGQTTKRS